MCSVFLVLSLKTTSATRLYANLDILEAKKLINVHHGEESCNTKTKNIERGSGVDQKIDFLNHYSDGRSETVDAKISLKRDRFTIHILDSEVGWIMD
jgi:hypothetical protein